MNLLFYAISLFCLNCSNFYVLRNCNFYNFVVWFYVVYYKFLTMTQHYYYARRRVRWKIKLNRIIVNKELNQTILIYLELNQTNIICLIYRFRIHNRTKLLEDTFSWTKTFVKEPNSYIFFRIFLTKYFKFVFNIFSFLASVRFSLFILWFGFRIVYATRVELTN